MQQKEEISSVAANLQRKGQFIEQEARREIAVLNDRILQLSAALQQLTDERNFLQSECA